MKYTHKLFTYLCKCLKEISVYEYVYYNYSGRFMCNFLQFVARVPRCLKCSFVPNLPHVVQPANNKNKERKKRSLEILSALCQYLHVAAQRLCYCRWIGGWLRLRLDSSACVYQEDAALSRCSRRGSLSQLSQATSVHRRLPSLCAMGELCHGQRILMCFIGGARPWSRPLPALCLLAQGKKRKYTCVQKTFETKFEKLRKFHSLSLKDILHIMQVHLDHYVPHTCRFSFMCM